MAALGCGHSERAATDHNRKSVLSCRIPIISRRVYGMDYVKTLKKLYKAPDLSASMIIDTFQRRDGISVVVERVDVGKPGFKIISDKGLFLLLERPIDYYNSKWGRVTNIQSLMLDYGIPVPLYLGQGDMTESFHKSTASKDPAAAVEKWLNEIF